MSVDPQFLADLEKALTWESEGEMKKQAACAFVNRWCAKLEDDKVDGTEVGITAPCKVAFESTERRDWFLSLFKRTKTASTVSIDDLAGRLVADGLVKGGVAEKLAAAGVKKHAQEGTTRRGKQSK